MQVRLNTRDEAVLSALARFGIARTSDLVRLVFFGVRRDTAACRLRRLFDAGFLEAATQGLSEENLYRLGPEGRSWAARKAVAASRAPTAGQEHHLAVVGIWAALARGTHELPGVSLSSFRADWELRGTPQASVSPVIPDALIELFVETGAGPECVRLAVEVDLATERPTTLRRKLTNYRQLLLAGEGLWDFVDFGLAIVIDGWSTGQKAGLKSLVESLWPGWWLSWDLKEGPDESLKQITEALQAPLTDSLYREGSLGSVTDGFSRISVSSGQGLSHEE